MSRASAKGAAYDAQRLRVLDRDGWVCTSCGNWLALDHPAPHHDATADHADPIADNPNKIYRDDELSAMCRSCNSSKGARKTVRVNWVNPKYLPGGLP